MYAKYQPPWTKKINPWQQVKKEENDRPGKPAPSHELVQEFKLGNLLLSKNACKIGVLKKTIALRHGIWSKYSGGFQKPIGAPIFKSLALHD